ncbi:MAG: acyltransferase [Saprospiraceae bacterium]|nr:acyltransferase [Saprospiraceae bacterium]
MQGKHLYSIDMLRGLVALLVCLYHFTEGFFPEDDVFRFIFSRGYLGVEIFFIISGFVIPFTMYKSHYEHSHAGNFMLKRLIRIEPPYWCSIALIFLIEYVSTFFRHYKDKEIYFEWKPLLYHVLHINDFLETPWLRGIYWSLAIEVQYYLLMALIFPFILFRKFWQTVAVLFCFCLGRWLDADELVFYYGCHFVTGIVLFNYHIGDLNTKQVWIGLLFCFGITLWCFDIYHLSASVGSALFILYFNKMVSPLVFLGKISYSFYLIHIQVGWTLLDAIERSYPNTNLMRNMIISIAITILASWLFYLLIEKPSHHWAQKIRWGGKAESLKREAESGKLKA